MGLTYLHCFVTVANFISGSGINPLWFAPKIGEVRGFVLINPPSSAMLDINDSTVPLSKTACISSKFCGYKWQKWTLGYLGQNGML